MWDGQPGQTPHTAEQQHQRPEGWLGGALLEFRWFWLVLAATHTVILYVMVVIPNADKSLKKVSNIYLFDNKLFVLICYITKISKSDKGRSYFYQYH